MAKIGQRKTVRRQSARGNATRPSVSAHNGAKTFGAQDPMLSLAHGCADDVASAVVES
jgi:hypothetical protein